MVRGKSVEEAQTILNFTIGKSVNPLSKLLKSALTSATHNFQLDPGNLYISKITVDEGPKLKRWRPRARGQAYEIQKKTSHITLLLDEIAKTSKHKIKSKKRTKKPEKIEAGEETEKKPQEVVAPKPVKPKFKPKFDIFKPKIEKGIRRIFRRKAF